MTIKKIPLWLIIFFCINGKAYCIEVCSNRKIGESPNICFYDYNWIPRPDMIEGSHVKDKFLDLSKPACLEEIIKNCRKNYPKDFPWYLSTCINQNTSLILVK